MPDNVIKTYEKILKIFFGDGHQKNISAIIYFTSGIIGILAALSVILPFSFSADFLDNSVLKRGLSDSELIVSFAFQAIIACAISGLIRRCVVHGFKYTSNKTIRIVYTHVYAIEDVIDLITALASLLFIITVFLHIYHTGEPYMTKKACVLYVWNLYKFVRLIYVFFANQTLKIIDQVNKGFPDLD